MRKIKILLVIIPFIIFAISFSATYAIVKIAKSSSDSSSEEHKKTDTSSYAPAESSKEKNDVLSNDQTRDEQSMTDSSILQAFEASDTSELSGSDIEPSKQSDNDSSDNQDESSDEKSSEEISELSETENSSEASDVSDSSEVSITDESSATAEPGHNKDLISYLESAGYTVDDLKTRNCSQIITVNSSGSNAVIRFFYLNENNVWTIDNSITADGFVGRNGVSKENYEGTGMTPFGLYEVGEAFYIDLIPTTSLDLFRVTSDTYWVDDPDSVFYNKKVEGTAQKDWNSAEHMIDYYASYHYGFVIEYNTHDTVPGKGSAFFFHVSSRPTAGCVGLSETMVLRYLSILDKNLNPFILMQ